MATKKGLVKKTSLSAYVSFVKRMNSSSITAVNLQEDDELIGVEISSGDDDVFLFADNGYAQHFCEYYKKKVTDDSETDDATDNNEESSDEEGPIDRHAGSGVRPSSRSCGCIRGIKLRGDAHVVSLMVVAISSF